MNCPYSSSIHEAISYAKGGNDPAIVCGDVDIQDVAAKVMKSISIVFSLVIS